MSLREAAKKFFFLNGPATKAFTTPPPGLVAVETLRYFNKAFKKKFFFPYVNTKKRTPF